MIVDGREKGLVQILKAWSLSSSGCCGVGVLWAGAKLPGSEDMRSDSELASMDPNATSLDCRGVCAAC